MGNGCAPSTPPGRIRPSDAGQHPATGVAHSLVCGIGRWLWTTRRCACSHWSGVVRYDVAGRSSWWLRGHTRLGERVSWFCHHLEAGELNHPMLLYRRLVCPCSTI